MASQRSRRVTLPGADELFFRPGGADGAQEASDTETERRHTSSEKKQHRKDTSSTNDRVKKDGTAIGRAPRPSGRQRHDEKITVYISSPELLALEQARLALRAEYGVSVDRGRIVREAVAVLLADFEENGRSSTLVRRLTED